MSRVSEAPVEEGETHYVEIEAIGDEGDGIAYVEGFVVVVPEGDLTEAVDVEIETVDDSFAIGSIVDGRE